ncbi:MAG: hypothetical protein U0354_21045 [Candidatus Sericytochromatia bacterium]
MKIKIIELKNYEDRYLVTMFNDKMEIITSEIPKNKLTKELELELLNLAK